MSRGIPQRARHKLSDLEHVFGWLSAPAHVPSKPGADPERHMHRTAAASGLELVRISASASELRSMICRCAPAIAPVRDSGDCVVIVSRGRRRVSLLAAGGATISVYVDDLFSLLCDRSRVDPLLPHLPKKVRAKASRILTERLSRPGDIADWWLVRQPPTATLTALLSEQGLGQLSLAWLSSHSLAYGCWVASFALVSRGALQGRLELGWMLGWVLLLATTAPLRALTLWLQGRIATRAGAVLKQRLLVGALQLPPDDLRELGIGKLLGRVQDAEVLERFALDGAFGAILALIELSISAALLMAAGCWLQAGCAALTFAAALSLASVWRSQRARWTLDRVSLTDELVQGLLGQSTRAVQAPPSRWHEEEDLLMERYLHSSKATDRLGIAIAAIPTLFVSCSTLLIGPSFVTGAADATSIAVSLGGTLLAGRAFDALCRGIQDMISASIAWREIQPLYEASSRPPSQQAPEVASLPDPDPKDPALELRDMAFRYPHAPPVLSKVQASIQRRDRILLQGPSGGGKSTLAAVILGLRQPSEGSISLRGLDHAVWGEEGWRTYVSGAPQFHQNHILAGTLAFNLLFGRRWPPTEEDLGDAADLCIELGLGPLLERMPSGLHQIVGETGWQLSHGERSRVFLARALLQGADILVFDESTAALDAQSTEWCLHRIHRQPAAIIVVAHP